MKPSIKLGLESWYEHSAKRNLWFQGDFLLNSLVHLWHFKLPRSKWFGRIGFPVCIAIGIIFIAALYFLPRIECMSFHEGIGWIKNWYCR